MLEALICFAMTKWNEQGKMSRSANTKSMLAMIKVLCSVHKTVQISAEYSTLHHTKEKYLK